MKTVLRLASVFLLAALSLQLYFLLRVALMAVLAPQSSSFERSEIYRLLNESPSIVWKQKWVPYERISTQLKRAVIASEDANFSDHSGVEWEALEKAWERNIAAQAMAEKRNEQIEKRQAVSKPLVAKAQPKVQPKIVGGSTITQQLAKNLFLSGERHIARKAQEFIIANMLEALLPKRRILEIYLNHVEWGEGVFGVEAAAQHYFHQPASQLNAHQAARLAVMLPAPKRFEKRPHSAYVNSRANNVMTRMATVDVP